MKSYFKYKLLLLLILLTTATFAQENIRWNGYVRNYTGLLTGGNNDFSIIQNTLDLEISARGDNIAFKANPYMYHYFDRDIELDLRELYLDLYFDKFDIRMGRQQIIYGKAEGVFITDVVSPKDLREFLLPDFDEIRMGVTAAKINYYQNSHTFELVWVPLFTPTKEPGEGSIWRPQIELPAPVDFDHSTEEVPARLENSEIFFRYSTLGSTMDIELVGGYFWDDDPTLHMTRHIENGELTQLTARPEHHRLLMGGGSFSLPLSGFVIRGEAAYYDGKHFQTQDPMVTDAVLEKNYLHYMAGFDYDILGWKLNVQFIQEFILDYEEDMRQDEFENTMTVLVRKDYFREKLWIELFSYIGLNNGDALIRPSITYEFADGFEILGGANVFLGDEGRFGQFSDNDMIYTKIRYNF